MSEASIVLSAVDKTKEAFQSVRGNLDGMHSSVNGLQGALMGLGSALGALAFANMVKSTIEAAGALHDLSQATGASVESLSKFASIGKLSGTSTEQIAAAMNKLAKNMASVTEDGKGAAAALRAIGIDFDDFQKLAPDEKFIKLSKTLNQFQDGSAKTAVRMALMGKEANQLAAVMNDVAVAGDMQAKITTEQAAKADAFGDNLIRLRASGEAWKKELSLGMLPALDEAAQAFTDVINGTGGLREEIQKLSKDGSLAEWTRAGITGLTYLMDAGSGVVRAFKSIGLAVGAALADVVSIFSGIAEGLDRALRGDFRGAGQAVSGIFSEMSSHARDFKADMDRLWSEVTPGQRLRAGMADWQGLMRAATETKKALKFGAEDKDKKDADPFKGVLRSIQERTAQFQAAAEQDRELTETEKLLAKVMADVENGTIKLTEARLEDLDTAFRQMGQSEEAAKLHERERKALVDAAKAHEDLIHDLDQGTIKIREELDAQLAHNVAVMSGKEAAAELTAAKLDEKAASLELLAIRRYEKELDYGVYQLYLDQAAALRELAAAKRQGGALDDSVKSFKSTFDSLDKTAHDVFNSMFESGASAFRKLRDTLRATLIDLLYQMTVKPFVVNIVAQMTGTPLAAAQTASGLIGQGGGGLGNIAGLGGMLGSLGTFGAGMSAGFGGLAGSIGSLFGAAGTGATFGGAISAGTTALGAGNIAGGLGTLAGALGPIALGASAIYSLINRHRGGPKMDGTFGQLSSGIGLGNHTGESDAAAAQAARAIQTQYSDLLRAFGGTGNLQFGLGFSTDPRGTSPTFLDVTASRGGNVAFGSLNRNVGRSQEELTRVIGEMSTQAILRGLRDANLTGRVGDYLRELGDVTLLTGDALAGALARVQQEAQRVEQVRVQRGQLEDRLFELTASEEAQRARMRERERGAIAEENRGRLDQIYAREDEIRATEAQRAASEELRAARERETQAMRDAMHELVDGAFADYSDTLRGNIDTLRETVSAERERAQSLREYLHALATGPAAMLSPEAQYQRTRAEFQRLAALAPGSTERKDNIQRASEEFLAASQAYNASSVAYFTDLAQVRAAVEASQIAAQVGVTTGEAALAVAQSQLDHLSGIRSNTLTTAQALQNLTSAIMTALGNRVGVSSNVLSGLYGNNQADTWQNGVYRSQVGDASAYAGVDNRGDLMVQTAGGGVFTIPQIQAAAQDFVVRGDMAGLRTAQAATGISDEALRRIGVKVPSYDVGNPFVQSDHLARVHRREAVLTPEQADEWRAGRNSNAAVTSGLQQVGSKLDALLNLFAAYAREDTANGRIVAANVAGAARAAFLANTSDRLDRAAAPIYK